MYTQTLLSLAMKAGNMLLIEERATVKGVEVTSVATTNVINGTHLIGLNCTTSYLKSVIESFISERISNGATWETEVPLSDVPRFNLLVTIDENKQNFVPTTGSFCEVDFGSYTNSEGETVFTAKSIRRPEAVKVASAGSLSLPGMAEAMALRKANALAAKAAKTTGASVKESVEEGKPAFDVVEP